MITLYPHNSLDSDTALRLVTIALKTGREAGVPVSAAVVDPAMQLVAFAKAPDATAHSAMTSRAKANTAASTRRETGWMGPELDPAIPLATGGQLTNITGGVPLLVNGECVGALGIAGGTPAQDGEVATTTVAAIG